MITFDVIGTPIPQGSMRAFVRGGRAMLVRDNNKPNVRQWYADVAEAARKMAGPLVDETHPVLYPRDVAIAVATVYRLALPKKHLRPQGGIRPTTPPFPTSKPDTDKLDRAVLDAITHAGNVWVDDSQVTFVVGLRCYVQPGEWTGAVIHIGAAEKYGQEVVEEALSAAAMRMQTILDVRLDHAPRRRA